MEEGLEVKLVAKIYTVWGEIMESLILPNQLPWQLLNFKYDTECNILTGTLQLDLSLAKFTTKYFVCVYNTKERPKVSSEAEFPWKSQNWH